MPDVTLLVDAMNVLGSRPTGWWRDRDGALLELAGRVRRYADHTGLSVTFVVDGAPIDGLPEESGDHFRVRYARRRGPDAADDRIVELVEAAGREVTVVSADRELRERAEARGARILGPSAFLESVDEVHDQDG